MSAFEQAFAIVVSTEGGYVNNSSDPGGETKFGISKRSYPALDIASLTLDAVRPIYRRDFWDRLRCDDLPPPLALLVFDAAVNCGQNRSARWLQAAVGTAQDGMVGPATVGAARASMPGWDVMARFGASRLLHHTSLTTWPIFRNGWAARLERLPYQAMGMTA